MTSANLTLRVRSEDGIADVDLDPPVADDAVIGLVSDVRESAYDVWVRDGESVRLAHHRHPDGFAEDLGLAGPVALDALEILLIEQPAVSYTLDEAGLTVWSLPLDGAGLKPFYTALASRIREGRAAPPGPAMAGDGFPLGPYRAGLWLVDVEAADEMARVVPVGHRILTRLLAELTPEELAALCSAFVEGRSLALDARDERVACMLEITGQPVRARVWFDGAAAEEVRMDLMALCLELQARATLLPTDGQDAEHWSTPEWLNPLRSAHVRLLAAIEGAGLRRFAPGR